MLRGVEAAAIACVLVFCGVAGDAAAAAAPRFDLDICTWSATHIVVATEGKSINGHLTVIESWVGPLAPGVELRLPKLAAFAPVESRRVRGRLLVTGARMVLFLKYDAVAKTWASAASWGHIEESVCWIKDDQAYALSDETNRYKTFIAPLRKTEKVVRARVRHLRAAKTALAEIRAMDDAAQRVAAAAKYANADSRLMVNEAFDVLKGCGKAAVPFLLSLSDEDLAGRYRYEVYETLGAIGDPSAVKPLVEKLETELRFWQGAKEKLDEGWWNGKSMGWREARPYDAHVIRVHYPLKALKGIPAPGYEDVVRRTRELWVSAPALRDVNHRQIVKDCDELLQAIERRQHRTK